MNLIYKQRDLLNCRNIKNVNLFFHQLFFRSTVVSMQCRFHQMSFQSTIVSIKCHFDQLSFRSRAFSIKCCLLKCRSIKCPSINCHNTNMVDLLVELIFKYLFVMLLSQCHKLICKSCVVSIPITNDPKERLF